MIFNLLRILIFNPLRDNFPQSPIFIQTAQILPKNPFRTSVFPKSPIFNPKALFLSKISIFFQSPIFYPNAPFLPLKSLQNVNFPYKPHFQPKCLFLPKNPFKASIFHKGPTPLSTQHSFQYANFSQKPHFKSRRPFLPDNLFRTSIFPLPFSTQTSLFYLKSLQRINIPQSPTSTQMQVPSEHQQPDSIPSTG